MLSPANRDEALRIALVGQYQTALTVLEQSERLHAIECALTALGHRAQGILEIRRAEAHEANRAQREDLQGRLGVLLKPAPSSEELVN
jgi:hypothetical protein